MTGPIAVAMCRNCLRRVWLYSGGRWVLADDATATAHWCDGIPDVDHDPIKVRPMLLRGGMA